MSNLNTKFTNIKNNLIGISSEVVNNIISDVDSNKREKVTLFINKIHPADLQIF